MNKSELLARLQGPLGGHQAAAAALDSVLGEITTAVAAGERVTLTGFGTFERVERPARTGRNPRTGDPLVIAASAAPRFHPGTALRAAVAGTTVAGSTVAGTTVSSTAAAASTTTPHGARGSRAAAASAPSPAVRRVRTAVRRVAAPVAAQPTSSNELAAPDPQGKQGNKQGKHDKHDKHDKHGKATDKATSGKQAPKAAKASADKKAKKKK